MTTDLKAAIDAFEEARAGLGEIDDSEDGDEHEDWIPRAHDALRAASALKLAAVDAMARQTALEERVKWEQGRAHEAWSKLAPIAVALQGGRADKLLPCDGGSAVYDLAVVVRRTLDTAESRLREVEAKLADALKEVSWQGGITKALLPYQERATTAESALATARGLLERWEFEALSTTPRDLTDDTRAFLASLTAKEVCADPICIGCDTLLTACRNRFGFKCCPDCDHGHGTARAAAGEIK